MRVGCFVSVLSGKQFVQLIMYHQTQWTEHRFALEGTSKYRGWSQRMSGLSTLSQRHELNKPKLEEGSEMNWQIEVSATRLRRFEREYHLYLTGRLMVIA
jgi:hypothetical protein